MISSSKFSERPTRLPYAMLRVLLLLWAWTLHQCLGHGGEGLCSIWWAFDNLELLADEEETLTWYQVGHEKADWYSQQPWRFGAADSFELAASVVAPDGWYAEATVWFFRDTDSRDDEIMKSCRIDNNMPRTRNCCETAFFSNEQWVGVNATCHNAQNPNGKCYIKVYARKNRMTTTATRTLTTTIPSEVEAGTATTERHLPFFLLLLTLAVVVQSS